MIEETSYTRLRARLFDCELPSPLVLASGPRSYNAASLIEAYKSGAGAVVTKTLRSTLPVIMRKNGQIFPGNNGFMRKSQLLKAILAL